MLSKIHALFPVYVRVAHRSLLRFTAVVSLLVAGAALAYPGGYPDPFAPYAALTPGQPVSVLRGFDCQAAYVPTRMGREICNIFPDDVLFSSIMITSANGVIQEVTFSLENVQVVDLVKHWGQPDKILHDRRHYIMTWDTGLFAFTARAKRRFHHQLPVEMLMLTAQLGS